MDIRSIFLELIFLATCLCLVSGQTCHNSKQNSAKFTLTSRRNQTGHWISQLILDHAADEQSGVSSWTADVDHTTVLCNGQESVHITATLTASPARAGPGYELRRGLGYYKLHSELKNWNEARQICIQEGAHLAIVNSEEESKALVSMFGQLTQKSSWIFIGFHDLYTEGQYLTIFDEPLTSTGFYRWASANQPDNAGGNSTLPGEDCGSIHSVNGGLNDLVCTAKVPFVCEQELW